MMLQNKRAEQFWRRLETGDDAERDELFPEGMDVRVLRQDALTKRWTLYIQNRRAGPKKPVQYAAAVRTEPRAVDQPEHVAKCPFCKGNEASMTPDELCRVWPSGALEMMEGCLPADEAQWPEWSVRGLRNIFPYLANPHGLYCRPCHTGPPAVRGETNNSWTHPDPTDPLYPQADGYGASEVIVESPRHNAQLAITTGVQVTHTLRVLAARGRVLRAHEHAQQMVFFKQYGKTAGAARSYIRICRFTRCPSSRATCDRCSGTTPTSSRRTAAAPSSGSTFATCWRRAT